MALLEVLAFIPAVGFVALAVIWLRETYQGY
jgi:hypothetical protein